MPNPNISLVALFWTACVTADQRPAADTHNADVEGVADTTTREDASDSAGTDARPETDTSDAATSDACQSDDACPSPADGNACAKATCDDGRCIVAPVPSGACDDDNRCTRDDYCDGLTCTGIALTCADLDPQCWTRSSEAVCDPELGCDGTPTPARTPCDDSDGPPPGSCHAGLITPSDQCDGEGACQTPPAPPVDLTSLAREWYLVVSSLPAQGEPRTLRALASLQANGQIAFSGVVSQDTQWQSDVAQNSPRYCIGADGRIRIESANRNYEGAVSARSRLMVLAERGGDQGLALAIENSGTPAQVNGTYRLAMTTTGPAGESLLTWRGRVNFTQGRITGNAGYEPQDGLGLARIIKLDGSPRLEPSGAIYTLEFKVTATAMADEDVSWTGAIGPRADVLLFTREDDGLNFGTILLVRDIGQPPSEALAGRWTFATHRRGASLPANPGAPLLESGTLEHGRDGRLGGFIEDATPAPVGGWWQLGQSDARVSYRIAARADDNTYGGWFAGDVIMAWRVAAPDAPDVPALLEDRPVEGSLFVGISPLDLAPLMTEPAR
jgi:hypothetical protein